MLQNETMWLDIFGWVGSALVVWSLMVARVLRFRWLNFVGAIIATVVNGLIALWPFFAMNLAIALIDAYWLWKLYHTRHDETTYEVIEVPVDDAYLQHVLHAHAEDIVAFSPSFTLARGPDEDRFAYLVLRGDETVGVVEVADEGDGTGRVVLDWVTKRFRDFTPGEFVYRRSGIFAGKGFARLVVGAGQHDDQYLQRVGFRRDGDLWVRELAA
jgi:hypothetical protein